MLFIKILSYKMTHTDVFIVCKEYYNILHTHTHTAVNTIQLYKVQTTHVTLVHGHIVCHMMINMHQSTDNLSY